MMQSKDKTLIIACGALSRVQEIIRENRDKYKKIYIMYGDCGTAGLYAPYRFGYGALYFWKPGSQGSNNYFGIINR